MSNLLAYSFGLRAVSDQVIVDISSLRLEVNEGAKFLVSEEDDEGLRPQFLVVAVIEDRKG